MSLQTFIDEPEHVSQLRDTGREAPKRCQRLAIGSGCHGLAPRDQPVDTAVAKLGAHGVQHFEGQLGVGVRKPRLGGGRQGPDATRASYATARIGMTDQAIDHKPLQMLQGRLAADAQRTGQHQRLRRATGLELEQNTVGRCVHLTTSVLQNRSSRSSPI